ncbi:GNAT family N-acetyltransferase [Neobacillus dielmonensis]|uniref:GNAT family N-acetyltransferase n=1 Tax=Neobacillus dielmonensis TaxID=1347369 RepID=UPI000693433C|nr:GNAT family N-acetyltransferase [Neobacillus dielmonensis]
MATFPEYRRTGHVKALITDALKQVKDKNQIVSLLAPIRYFILPEIWPGNLKTFGNVKTEHQVVERT